MSRTMLKHNKWVLERVNELFEPYYYELQRDAVSKYWEISFVMSDIDSQYFVFSGDMSEITCFCSGLLAFAEKHKWLKKLREEK